MLIVVSQSSGQPIYGQIVEQIRHAIEMGVLKPGEALPTIRALAEQLVVSPNTVVKAYSLLEQQGILTLRQGAGAFVSSAPRNRSRTERLRGAQERVRMLVQQLQDEGFADDEIHRFFQSELFYAQRKA